MLKIKQNNQQRHKSSSKSIRKFNSRQIRTKTFKKSHQTTSNSISIEPSSPTTQQNESISTSTQHTTNDTIITIPTASISTAPTQQDTTLNTVYQLHNKSVSSTIPKHAHVTPHSILPENLQILNATSSAKHPHHTSARSFQTRYNTVPNSQADSNSNREAGQGGNFNQNYVSPAQQNKGVYTSSHYQLTRETIANYLTRKNLTFKHSGDKTIIMECPLCPKPTYGKPDNLWKLCIFDNGGFVCLRCQSKGSWYDFKSNLGDLPNITNSVGKPIYQRQLGIINASTLNNTGNIDEDGADEEDVSMKQYMKEQQQEYQLLSQQECQKMVTNLDSSPLILNWFENERQIKRETLVKYHVGSSKQKFPALNPTTRAVEWVEHDCMTFPWTDRKSVTDETSIIYTRVKFRSSTDKKNMRLLPKGGSWGFFGWHTVPLHAKSIIITEGEVDAMSVFQTTGLPTISLPNGANSLPPTLLPCLERFEKIILWLDDDQSGHAAVESMTTKLGPGRTYHVPGGYGAKDANEALQKGLNIGAILDTATRQQHKQISTFASFRHEVKQMFLDPNTQVGVAFPNMPGLQALIKGHRRGEFTILTGGTGVGKTTLLTQISLELAQQGVNTLWGSFEIRNPRLVKTMMKQYAAIQGVVLNEQHPEAFDYIADKFEELPLNFLKFYGSSPVQEVIEAMEYATYVHDVQHIILDNLQFMLSGQGRAVGDKFDLQDRAIEAFRQFASQRNVHVTIVIHPRKEQDNSSLGLASVFGSAKATQEADNVMIVQGGLPRTVLRNIQLPETEGRKTSTQLKQVSGDLSQGGGFDDPIVGEIMSTFFRTIEIRKNRWDGDLGSVPLRFDKSSSRFYELSSDDISLGLGEFIMKQKKLKQMDLIKHMNQLPGAVDSQSQSQSQQHNGFQNYQQSYHHNVKGTNSNANEKPAPTTRAGIHNALDQHFSQHTQNSRSSSGNLTPEQEQQLLEQFDQYAGNGDGQVTGVAYGSPEALAVRNMENKMLNEMATEFEGTNMSSGKFENHPQFQQLQQQQQQFQKNAVAGSFGSGAGAAAGTAGATGGTTYGGGEPDASQFKKHKPPNEYEPTIDIVFE